jgi:O-acetyl-ADP-ribose deacetylase (regulator of RNase III)
MITFTQGNLLNSDAEALVNTVNTVGIMGKGIALMFKEAFPENNRLYEAACKKGDVKIGRMLVTERHELLGPKWIINFPTKKHWRNPSRIEWIEEGLVDLKRVIQTNHIRSVGIPPLGSGNGGLDWSAVRAVIQKSLDDIPDVKVIVFEPTAKYQNVAKREGVEKLTPARALMAELVRRYWVLGFECSVLEVQKLAYFVERTVRDLGLNNILNLRFEANKYGPYAHRLTHLLNALDGSYLHCDRRIADASIYDVISFDESKRDFVAAYFTTPEAKPYRIALETTAKLIDGFQSPLGMELLATVDWLVREERVPSTIADVRAGLAKWPAGEASAKRKLELFDDRLVGVALEQLASVEGPSAQRT